MDDPSQPQRTDIIPAAGEGYKSADVMGQVTDLTTVGTTDTSVTLEFTAVDNGTGHPADYAIRYGSPTIEWSAASATEVAVPGSGVGSTMGYTYSSLQSGTAYEFQVVAYRGTLNVDAVLGPVSSKASATTTGGGGGGGKHGRERDRKPRAAYFYVDR